MRRITAVVLFIILGLCVNGAYAAHVSVFGPAMYVRDTATPVNAGDTFFAQSGDAVLVVRNGNDDGSLRVTSADISLNGGAIFSPDEFKQKEGLLQAVVTLSEINAISVQLGGKPGSFLTVEIIEDVDEPTVTVQADPETIMMGDAAILTWESTDADYCTIEPDIGDVDPRGSISVSPAETTTYIITATGRGGIAAESVTVSVENPITPPHVEFQPALIRIHRGDSANLAWTSSDALTAFIDNGVGAVPLSGSIILSPDHTTTYTITVAGDTGAADATATVMVLGSPEPLAEGSFGWHYKDVIPPDATVESFDQRRFAVITGLVHTIDDTPLENVSVTILDHPEYGTALTDETGRFSIPLDGGGAVNLEYRKAGFLSSQRTIHLPWNDVAVAETIQMLAADPRTTTFTFDGKPETIATHRSTTVEDECGRRSCTMVLSGDNQAYLVDKEGNDVQELSTITVRATEYITEKSMPAALPPNVAYTYCAELGVEGAARVRFRKPVTVWVDNFLGFDVGEVVPVGYFDRDRGIWICSDNGVVVRLLDTDSNGTVDALDADGDNSPDDMNGSGVFTDEVTGLGDSRSYLPNSTYWRVSVTHFTPWDCNWPYGPPEDFISPNPKGEADADEQKEENKGCPTKVGNNGDKNVSSYIEERSRIIHEDIPIPGTGITLHYASNRAEGYTTSITVPASGDTVPASLKHIIVRVNVVGKRFEQILDPLPHQQAFFEWDGRNYLGKPVEGTINAHIELGFVYDLIYYSSQQDFDQTFGQAGTNPVTVVGRSDVIIWKHNDIMIHKGHSSIAEDWTISNHHRLNPTNPSVLLKGNGAICNNNISIVETVAGTGVRGYAGDGGPAVDAQLYFPGHITVDAEGNYYITEYYSNRIRKVDTKGIISTVAGNTIAGYGGDGGLAVDAKLKNPLDVAVDGKGNLYIADYRNHRVRKVDTSGIITTVAGTGVAGYSSDGGPPTEAQLFYPYSVTTDTDGNLYVADATDRVRKVSTCGVITTVAGNGDCGYSGDGGPAIEARLNNPYDVTVDSEGTLYIVDEDNHRIRKVDTSGIITTVAGNGIREYSGDGGLATAAGIGMPHEIAVDDSGTLYITDYYNLRIRRVDSTGIISTIAGNGIEAFPYDQREGITATEANVNWPTGVALDPVGNLYFTDDDRIRKVALPSIYNDRVSGDDIVFVEKDGRAHVMSRAGRHEGTIDANTGIPLYSFSYDELDRLETITDRFDNQITIQRDVDGVPTAIVSPDGLVTGLEIDEDNHLVGIIYPDGRSYEFEYTEDGLLLAKTEPEGNRYEHAFDEQGRLTDARDEEGGHWHYARTVLENGDILTESLTGEGNRVSYLDHTYSTGKYTSTITGPTGETTQYSQASDSLSVAKSLSCGMDLAFTYDIDPEYKFKYVKTMTETTPGSVTCVTNRDRTYQDTDRDDIPDLITDTITVNGKTTILKNNILQSRKAVTSPQGRTITSLYNPNNLLPTALAIPGLYTTSYGYDDRGRLISLNRGTRNSSFTYDTEGFLASSTDPEGHTTFYEYDPTGWLTRMNRPDGSILLFTYDGNGNMEVLTAPSDVDHIFGYNRVNRNDYYQTPLSGGYRYVYDKDRRPLRTEFPSGAQISNIYDRTRLMQIQTPEGTIDYTYLCGTRVGSISNGTDTITYEYDGKLMRAARLTGTISERLSYNYNNDFNMTEFFYAGDTEQYFYDDDGLLTGAGQFSISRTAGNGLPVSVSGGSFRLNRTFNGYGEVDAEKCLVAGHYLSEWDIIRDGNGRIMEKDETIGGTSSSSSYTYDALGRLLTVSKDGTLVEEYRYGPNGTRTYEMNSLRGITGRTFDYSDEDHLLTAGNTVYEYNLDGFLTTRTDGTGGTTYFDYSTRGELLEVVLPDGTTIEYLHDPLGRRIAKKVNGTIVEKYLWQGMTKLLAIYDGNDNLETRFEYADGRVPVAMTRNGITYYLACDQVGSLRIIGDSSGNVVKQIDYDSFGTIINDSNPAFRVPFGFAGGLNDRDTGLVRFGYRDYDPDTGRWTAKDPILFAGGDTDLYGYCVGDPVNLVDTLGLWGLYVGGSLIGIDLSAKVYDSDKGWFPNSTTYIGASTTVFGGGIQITFDDPCNSEAIEFNDILVSWGLGKYLGISYNPTLTFGSVNLGLSLGLPISFSTSIESFAAGVSKLITSLFDQ